MSPEWVVNSMSNTTRRQKLLPSGTSGCNRMLWHFEQKTEQSCLKCLTTNERHSRGTFKKKVNRLKQWHIHLRDDAFLFACPKSFTLFRWSMTSHQVPACFANMGQMSHLDLLKPNLICPTKQTLKTNFSNNKCYWWSDDLQIWALFVFL